MSNLVRSSLRDALPVRRGSLERQYSQELSLVRANAELATARETAKVETIANVTEAALLATSHVSAVEALLVQRTPHAEARLQHIADAGCTGMASVVLRIGSRL